MNLGDAILATNLDTVYLALMQEAIPCFRTDLEYCTHILNVQQIGIAFQHEGVGIFSSKTHNHTSPE